MDTAFQELLKNTKLRLLKMHREANAGHLGGNFSCIDALMTLHHKTDKARTMRCRQDYSWGGRTHK